MTANETRPRTQPAAWLDQVGAWTRQATAATDRPSTARFPVAQVLGAWRSVGREAADRAWVSAIDRALHAVESRSAVSPGAAEPSSQRLLGPWLPMLVDVHHARCRYATYVGTELLQQLTEVGVGGIGAFDSVIRTLLAQLLDFELGGGGAFADSRLEPPSKDLSRRRTAAIVASLQVWVVPQHRGLEGRELTDAVLDSCAPDFRLAADCTLVPITRVHDEVLFIRVLQVFETVFLQVHGLLADGRDRMLGGDLAAAGYRFRQAADALDAAFPVFRLLATIRPDSFAIIRRKTTGASGLQSVAFKRIELLAAAPSSARASSEAFAAEEVAGHVSTERPSIEAVLGRDRSARTDPLILTGLAAMDRAWLRWKRAHWAVAAHVIGSSPGTGGTSGVSYLRAWMTDPLIPRLPQPRGVSGSHVSLAAHVAESPMARHLREQIIVTTVDESHPDVIALPAARRHIGEFKVDVRSAAGHRAEVDESTCRALADALALEGGVDSAVPVPPNVYITPSLDALRDVVLEAVSAHGAGYRSGTPTGERAVQVQYACPNLNKALHVGHLRNIFLGSALANIIEAAGHRVVRVDQPSNRGRHIAKAVLAHQLWGGTATPADRDEKPDHFVQRFYTEFAERLAGEDAAGLEEQLQRKAELLDGGDEQTVAAAEQLTRWAYEGIQQTYGRLGERFDAVFAEGDTLDLAEDLILSGSDVVRRRSDQSVFIDLSDRGLREITLLRRDGSPLLHAQFLGACLRREELDPDTTLLFVMGEEYRHTVPELLGTLELLGHEELASRIEAVHHGMVTASGHKVSSREGGALTADGLLDQVRDRLVREWEQDASRGLGFHERDVCDKLAIAMVRLEFLGTRRDRPIELDVDRMWDSAPQRIAQIVTCLAHQDGIASARDRRAGDPRPLLQHLDQFGNHIADAVHRRDPFVLVRYLDDLCRYSNGAGSTGDGQTLAQASATVARRALQLLGIHLPPFPSLPPAFRPLGS